MRYCDGGAVREVSLFDFSLDPTKRLRFGRPHWRLFSNHEHAWNGSIPVQRYLCIDRPRRAAQPIDQRRYCPGPVHRLSIHRRVAVRFLSSIYRSGYTTAPQPHFPSRAETACFLTHHAPHAARFVGPRGAAIFAAAMSSSLMLLPQRQ